MSEGYEEPTPEESRDGKEGEPAEQASPSVPDADGAAETDGSAELEPEPDVVSDAESDIVAEAEALLAGSAASQSQAPDVATLTALVAERTEDLQRLHAEYANYKKRVDRDRSLARAAGIEAVVLDLLPVLDSVEAAREHDELVGGFKLVAEELEKTAAKYGLETFGEVGDAFDPQIHEALMAMPMDGELEGPTVSAVMQHGVKLNGRVIRPARVGVADPEQH